MSKEEKKVNNKEKKTLEDEKVLNQKQKSDEKVNKKNEELEKEFLRLEEQMKRLAADNANERKRHFEELEKMRKYANRQLIKEILPFLDNYDKAIEAGKKFQDSKVDSFLLGFQMMKDEIWKIMNSKGVKEIKITPNKDLFDSSLHEVVDEVENNELEPNTILEVVRKGYLLNGQLLIPSRVKLSKKMKKN